jgi:anti-anti-sigma regulatory factor
MVQFEKKKLNDGSLHVSLIGKIDERFDGEPVLEAVAGNRGKVVLHLAGIRSISSLGVRAFETFVERLQQHEVVMIHISPAVASQMTMIPSLNGHATVESAKLPFACPSCGAEKSHSIPWRANSAVEHAPKCTCGTTMDLDGLPEQYLPS